MKRIICINPACRKEITLNPRKFVIYEGQLAIICPYCRTLHFLEGGDINEKEET